MKQFNLIESNNNPPEIIDTESPSIEINEKYVSYWKSSENLKHEQNIKYILKNSHQQEQKQSEDPTREDQQLKFKYASIVIDRLFFYVALIYAILTFIGLIIST